MRLHLRTNKKNTDMKVATLLGERFKKAPADCVFDSQALMVRGGYIKSVGTGLFSFFMPTKRIAKKIENITFTYLYDKTKDHTYNGDKTNLNSAVGNLIKNAVQAIGSKPNGKIEVRLDASETVFTIAVKDNGKGIKEEDKTQVFLPNFTTKTGGSGVGLSLTYNIVQVAGGTISFESQVGEGTEFVIELPK